MCLGDIIMVEGIYLDNVTCIPLDTSTFFSWKNKLGTETPAGREGRPWHGRRHFSVSLTPVSLTSCPVKHISGQWTTHSERGRSLYHSFPSPVESLNCHDAHSHFPRAPLPAPASPTGSGLLSAVSPRSPSPVGVTLSQQVLRSQPCCQQVQPARKAWWPAAWQGEGRSGCQQRSFSKCVT